MVIKARFNARWLIAGASLVTVLVTSSLGVWQLGRAEEKESIQKMRQLRVDMPPATVQEMSDAQSSANWEPLLHRRVDIRGRWLENGTVYLNNRPMNGQAGFLVVTPFALADIRSVVLVQRGWVARDPVHREKLPDLHTPAGLVTIEGRFAPPPSRMYELGKDETGRIRQNLSPSELSAELGVRVEPVSVLQLASTEQGRTSESDGLLRHWPTMFPNVHKHYGYAFQWFGLSALVVVLYVWFQIIVPRRRGAHA
jgi:surfeit locus 1 family protein